MVVTLRLDIGVGHQEHREDDADDIPARENQAGRAHLVLRPEDHAYKTYVNVSETEPILSGAYQAEKATIAGI